MSDRFLTLAQLGQHTTHCTIRAQRLAASIVLLPPGADVAPIEAELAELEREQQAVIARLRAALTPAAGCGGGD